jgi:hypothetical protein
MAVDLTQIPAQCGIHATLAECERMGDMVANIVTAVAVAKYPDDPDAATAFALASIDRVYGLGPAIEAVCVDRPEHREDIELNGCCDRCGTWASQEPGYYPRELETATEAAADLEVQETT